MSRSAFRAQNPIPESDALLMLMQKSRLQPYRGLQKSTSPTQQAPDTTRNHPHGARHHILQTEEYYSPSPVPTPQAKADKRARVMTNLQKNHYLSEELVKHYGGRAPEVAAREYARDPQHKDKNEPRLIDEVIAARTKLWSDKKEDNAEMRRKLNEERKRLMLEREKIQERKKQMSPISGMRPAAGSAASQTSVYDIGKYLTTTQDSLPDRIKHLEHLRQEYEDRLARLVKPYNGELGPASYAFWQMPHYHMCREIVEEEVERFLDLFFPASNPVASREEAVAKLEEDGAQRERRLHNLSVARASQLIMEEIVLQYTGEIAKEIGREYRNMHFYVQNRCNMNAMRQAEAFAVQDENGRPEDDPLYNLITKGFFSYQRERFNRKSDLWVHRQHTHVKDPTNEDKDTDKDEEVEILYFGDILPIECREHTIKPHDSYPVRLRKLKFEKYMAAVQEYWKKIWQGYWELDLGAKCKGITASAVSWTGRLLALGTTHGDLLVYEVPSQPVRIVRAVPNTDKDDDPIDSIAWSMDGSKLITTSTKGGSIKAWQWCNENSTVNKVDLKAIGIKPDEAGFWPMTLKNVLDLDVDRFETRFQSGAYAEMDLHKDVYGPTMASFFPTMTFVGTQNHMCVALDNGDVLKCDLEESYKEQVTVQDNSQDGAPVTSIEETPKIYKPTIQLDIGISRIGQGVPAELFRQHQYPIVFMGFVNNNENMITVDQKGFINRWSYHPRTLNTYNIFKAEKRYRIDFHKTMYTPIPGSNPNIVFTDRVPRAAPTAPAATGTKAPAGPQGTSGGQAVGPPAGPARTRQEIARERREAEKTLLDLQLADPWHKQPPSAQRLELCIYTPTEAITDNGGIFHLIIRRASDEQLSSYATRIYKPVKVKSDKMIGCKMSADGKELVFVFLFSEYPPKSAHLSVVRLDLITMTMKDWRRDITVDSALYLRIKQENVVSFALTQVHGTTGSSYIFLNIAGDLHAYSMVTGLRVVKNWDETKPDTPEFSGLVVGDDFFKLADCSELTVANYADGFYIYAYASPQRDNAAMVRSGKNKKVYYRLVVIELIDTHTDGERLAMWKLYADRPDKDPLPTINHVTSVGQSRTPFNHHPAAFIRELLMNLMDIAVTRKTGLYIHAEKEAILEMDRVRNYGDFKAQMEEARDPNEEYDPTDIQRPNSQNA